MHYKTLASSHLTTKCDFNRSTGHRRLKTNKNAGRKAQRRTGWDKSKNYDTPHVFSRYSRTSFMYWLSIILFRISSWIRFTFACKSIRPRLWMRTRCVVLPIYSSTRWPKSEPRLLEIFSTFGASCDRMLCWLELKFVNLIYNWIVLDMFLAYLYVAKERRWSSKRWVYLWNF